MKVDFVVCWFYTNDLIYKKLVHFLSEYLIVANSLHFDRFVPDWWTGSVAQLITGMLPNPRLKLSGTALANDRQRAP